MPAAGRLARGGRPDQTGGLRGLDVLGPPGARVRTADAPLLIIGLAPAAHGGNRTGRMFTGDRSGDVLYQALYDVGLAVAADLRQRRRRPGAARRARHLAGALRPAREQAHPRGAGHLPALARPGTDAAAADPAGGGRARRVRLAGRAARVHGGGLERAPPAARLRARHARVRSAGAWTSSAASTSASATPSPAGSPPRCCGTCCARRRRRRDCPPDGGNGDGPTVRRLGSRMPLYPEIEPYDHGMLDVGDGNRVYWEACGNPRGKPAVVLHGGPGSGCTPFFRRLVRPGRVPDRAARPARLRAVDAAGERHDTDMSVNTTAHLIADLELLRRAPGDRAVAGVGRVVGVGAGAAVRADASRGGVGAGADRGRHRSRRRSGPADQGAGKDLPGGVRAVPGRAAGGRAGREPRRGLPPAARIA